MADNKNAATSEERDQVSASLEQDAKIGMTDEQISEIEDALHEGYDDGLIESIHNLSPADAAELISKVSDDDREELLEKHSAAFQPAVFTEMPSHLCKELFESMEAAEVANIISQLESDDALDLIQNIEPDFQDEIIRNLSGKMRLSVKEGLSFPEESAGRLMQREFVAIPQFWTVGKTIDYLRASASELPEDFFDIFIITPTYHIIGEVPLNRVVRSQRSEKMSDLILDDIHTIPASLDQEEVAQIFRRENLISAPVVDESERLIGVITIDDVVDVIDEEAEEDILKLAGVEQSGDLYRAILSTTGSRFRWLFVNLLTAIFASTIIALFDATIKEIVALAILMPIVASMGGNAGTQALTVAVRALATRELSRTNALRIVWKETVIGTINGSAFAIILGAITALWFGNHVLGLVIASAMIINLICAGLCGAGIPILLHRMGNDPAVSSTVVLTTVTDVIGFSAFLGLAAIFLM